MSGHKKGRKGHGHHKGGHKGGRHHQSPEFVEFQEHKRQLLPIHDPQVRLVTARLRGMHTNPYTGMWLDAAIAASKSGAFNALMYRIREAFRPS
jgi:hypothetical protein